MKLVIIGSYGAGNIGDEAMKDILKSHFGEHDCVFLTGDPKAPNEAPHLPFGIRSFFKFNWLKSYRSLRKSDAVFFGGGGLWAEHESIRAIFLWTWHFFWAYAFRKPIYLIALSFGPFKSRLGRSLTRWVLKSADYVSVRDELSLKQCQQIFPIREYERTSDLCFMHEALPNKSTKKIAINLRPWDFDSETFKDFFNSLKGRAYELVFIANDPSDHDVLSEFGDVTVPKDFTALCENLSECEYAIGMRLHFMIAAALSGCKLIALSYSPKVEGVMSEIHVSVLHEEDWTLNGLENAFSSAVQASALKDYAKESLDSLKALPL